MKFFFNNILRLLNILFLRPVSDEEYNAAVGIWTLLCLKGAKLHKFMNLIFLRTISHISKRRLWFINTKLCYTSFISIKKNCNLNCMYCQMSLICNIWSSISGYIHYKFLKPLLKSSIAQNGVCESSSFSYYLWSKYFKILVSLGKLKNILK